MIQQIVASLVPPDASCAVLIALVLPYTRVHPLPLVLADSAAVILLAPAVCCKVIFFVLRRVPKSPANMAPQPPRVEEVRGSAVRLLASALPCCLPLIAAAATSMNAGARCNAALRGADAQVG